MRYGGEGGRAIADAHRCPAIQAVLAGKPVVHDTVFESQPDALFYFEDSSVILVHDSGNSKSVWRSTDDGKGWTQIEEVKGKAFDIMEHPFDKNRAVIFGEGKDHWVTNDKGEHWKKFTAEFPVSFHQVPMVFNAANPDYALYSGRECTMDELLPVVTCRDKVRKAPIPGELYGRY